MMDQLVRSQATVLFWIRKLATQLSWRSALKNHWCVCRRQMPTRRGEIKRPVTSNTRCARRQVVIWLVLGLVTIGALEWGHALSINSTTKPKPFVRLAMFTLQWRVTCRMTVDAAGVHED